jgi:AcrR family transcriptional regulator
MPTRRDRLRASTSQEIIQTARRLLVEQGSAAISLRAIAREMGMTAPALYRYFASHEELIRNVIADIFTELSDYVEDAVRGADPAAGRLAAAGAARGLAAAGAAADRAAIGLITACHAFRRWATAHPAEFGLIFGTPLAGLELYHDDPMTECGQRFGGIFLGLFADLWAVKPFDVPPDAEIAPALRPQLVSYRDLLGTDLPLGALQTFLRCWVLLYGTVSLDVFGHLKFALNDASELFELMLADLASMVGLEYAPPA